MSLTIQDIQALFNKKLPAAAEKDPKRIQKIGKVVYQFEIAGAGSWTLDCASAKVTSGAHPKPTCTLTSTSLVFSELMENPKVKAVSLFMQGKITIGGDPMVALALGDLLDLIK